MYVHSNLQRGFSISSFLTRAAFVLSEKFNIHREILEKMLVQAKEEIFYLRWLIRSKPSLAFSSSNIPTRINTAIHTTLPGALHRNGEI